MLLWFGIDSKNTTIYLNVLQTFTILVLLFYYYCPSLTIKRTSGDLVSIEQVSENN